ncbi:DUF1178 family protein [Hyphomicrobiales bacterium]|jgi:hypothetical protein|nr:DUF1178 family protein [Hyphomicrobiales bacterium]|tara:strand:- start:11 stop:430 length:420 start_codon:yes stop_codon:yes gene_type:complete
MIKYSLECNQSHTFDAWFSDSLNFEKQNKNNQISCPNCSSLKIKKSIMAPSIPSKNYKSDLLNEKKDKVEVVLSKVRKHVEDNFDYVGDKFADEARSMHYGEKEEREIYGETTIEDAVDLIEEGVNVKPMPGVDPKLKN